MESWDSMDCIAQQLLHEVGDDCIVQQLMTTQIQGTCKNKYCPASFTDQELATFNNYQHITKKHYEEQTLSELQSVSKMFRSAKYHLEHSLEGRLETKDACDSRFYSTFNSLNDCCLNKAYKCSLLNPILDTAWEGECYLCNEFFCFAINPPEMENYFIAPLKISIPYVEIIAITKAGRKYHHDHINGKKPEKESSSIGIISLNECKVKPSVLQIWTKEKKVHQFFGFGGQFDQVFTRVFEYLESVQMARHYYCEYPNK